MVRAHRWLTYKCHIEVGVEAPAVESVLMQQYGEVCIACDIHGVRVKIVAMVVHAARTLCWGVATSQQR